ncbi:MAG: tetratricopeptide repeat protein [Fimbriimonadaceae bacterium]|nr:tetratricopeptide repeat protein [Fimbriimonadaceae bacterium]
MAVQEPSKDVILCDRCFAMVKAEAEFCPDCGAPIAHDDAPSEGSDAAIYPELARANLLRMRGEYKQAEDICLSILRRFPNNATANGLLGDMKAEQGDLEQAAEWYELALDLVDDTTIKTKLVNVKKRIQEREVANTAKQIGLPSNKPKTGLYVVVILILIGGSAAAAYMMGQQSNIANTNGKQAMTAPLNIPGNSNKGDKGTANPDNGDEGATVEPPIPSAKPEVDRQLIQALSLATTFGAKVIDAFQDPRTKQITVTFVGTEGENLHTIAAELGKAALDSHLESPKVTIRGIVSNRISLVADMTRESLRSLDTPEWKQAHESDPDAWANAVLSNVWPPTANSDASRSEAAPPSERGDASGQPLQGN